MIFFYRAFLTAWPSNAWKLKILKPSRAELLGFFELELGQKCLQALIHLIFFKMAAGGPVTIGRMTQKSRSLDQIARNLAQVYKRIS